MNRLLGVVVLLVLTASGRWVAADPVGAPRLVVVLYPLNHDGSPGTFVVDQSIRATMRAGASGHIEILNEYLDIAGNSDEDDEHLQRDYLRRKYQGRTVDVVIAALSPALDFVLQYPDVFPGCPTVFCAVDYREVQARELPSQVIGVPMEFSLEDTLKLALQLHPKTQLCVVVAGNTRMDHTWEQEARRTFQRYESQVRFRYLTGLPLPDLLEQVATLPDHSVIYYLHVFRDGDGKSLVPAHVLESLARVANAPIYGHADSYIGRGVVGGRVMRFETEARHAAQLALRLLDGEVPGDIGVLGISDNAYEFDARQLTRWGVDPSLLPSESVVHFREPTLWDQYRWQLLGVAGLISLQALLITALLVQRANRRRANQRFRQSVEAAPNGMLVVDCNGTIMLANAQMEKMFGYRKSDMVGQPVEMLVPEGLHARHARQRQEYSAAPVARTMAEGRELSGRHRDGHEIPVEIGLSPLSTDEGTLVVASVIDVSARRRAEEGLRTSTRQLQQLSDRLITAQEDERRRIARDLHDDFNQSLALLAVEMDLLRQRPPESAAQLGERVDELSARVRQISSDIHELSHELHPLKLDQLGLVAAIRSLCQEVSRSHELTVTFTPMEVPAPIPPDISLCLYRIVQESLHNVVKHSGAAHAVVTLTGGAAELHLQIQDEGRGFESSAVQNGGLGLIGMQERLRLVGGELKITARPSWGTQIDARVPWPVAISAEEELPAEVGRV